jgi:RHH-type rel operon transcriptional repressor/antitoxin RelB
VLSLRLSADTEERLNRLARKTGRTKSYHARRAILSYLDDLEDAHLAKSRLRDGRPRVGLEKLAAELEAKFVRRGQSQS